LLDVILGHWRVRHEIFGFKLDPFVELGLSTRDALQDCCRSQKLERAAHREAIASMQGSVKPALHVEDRDTEPTSTLPLYSREFPLELSLSVVAGVRATCPRKAQGSHDAEYGHAKFPFCQHAFFSVRARNLPKLVTSHKD
jgi:hypothetical protein